MVKNILFIVNSLPYPIYKDGISLINYRLLEKSPANYRFHIVSFSTDKDSTKEKLLKLFPHIFQITCIPSPNRCVSLLNLIFYAFGCNSLFSDKYWKYACDLDSFDLIYFCAPPSPLYFRKLPTHTPVFLNAIDSFALLNERFYQCKKSIFTQCKRWLYRQAEKKCFALASMVNFVSDVDLMYVKENSGLDNLISITNGVDTNYFSFYKGDREETSILFVGNYNYIPNVKAVVYFVNRIFPLLKKKCNKLKFYIVGINPPFNFQRDDIVVTGFVKDIRIYYQKCTLFVSPLLTGSGIKNKVLEAMASGIPVVSTPIGADGINGLIPGQNIEIVYSEKEMIDKIDLLLKDSPKRALLANRARKLIETHYNWNLIVEQYYNMFDKLKKL